ncbi:hypothetical protein [Butyrivibrio sp.]|uniref:hypothetical protein n=1 Tax=Butyrivibrio sp. TaxID=28121 RepID=UPI0025CE7604|nr:hypothetical protein [Butyrivibrio sp.]
MKFNNFMYTHMQGRYITYGYDAFSKFLFGLTFIFIFVNIIAGSGIISLITLGLIIYSYYRLLSKKIPERYKENEQFISIKNRVVGFFKNFRYNANQARNYHIYKCPGCGQKIRIPRGKGNIMVRCPKCGTEFQKRA